MWWAVDEDWVESAPAIQAPSAKRHLERKGGRKGKRACKARNEIGYVHAADPVGGNATSTVSDIASVSVSASVHDSSASQSVSGSATSIVSAGNSTLSADPALAFASDSSVSESPSSSSSATASSGVVSKPVQSGTSAVEGEQDGIQLYVGRSLVQVAKEGFERYAQGLDTTWNVLEYPSSGTYTFPHGRAS
jgi:hypothetical protein